jgi:hypothetical protein
MLKPNRKNMRGISVAAIVIIVAGISSVIGRAADPPDPLLDLFVKKGFVTQQEADAVKAEADAMRTNEFPNVGLASKWRIRDAIKDVELFGDIRLRYEHREALGPNDKGIKLDRGRYALRLGIRGDAFDNFYYGLRVDTAANPRSPWVTFGQASTASPPYNGPFGKSTAGINVAQAYIGWRPTSWLDITVGQMPMPLYTTPMVWDSDLNPAGAAEHLKYTIGEVDLFANFGQFLYFDGNPDSASGGFGFGANPVQGQNIDTIFQIDWQAGLVYHIQTNIYAKAAGTVYTYSGLGRDGQSSPFFDSPFVGEGAYLGTNYSIVNGFSGYPNGTPTSFGFPNNQYGIDHLLIVEVPFEFGYKFPCVDTRFFGDFAYNLEGRQRAQAAQAGYAAYLASFNNPVPAVTAFRAQTDDVKAYQIGIAVASPGNLGLVYGQNSRRNAWELRSYWQHIEQYALDPNLLDSDFFEGRGNLEGLYVSAAYGFGANVIGTIRYGYAHRINNLLGTGGNNQDIPQVNPIDHYNIFQADLTFLF